MDRPDPTFDPGDELNTVVSRTIGGVTYEQYGATFDDQFNFVGWVEGYTPKTHGKKNAPKAKVDKGYVRTIGRAGAREHDEAAKTAAASRAQVRKRQTQELLDEMKAENEAALHAGT